MKNLNGNLYLESHSVYSIGRRWPICVLFQIMGILLALTLSFDSWAVSNCFISEAQKAFRDQARFGIGPEFNVKVIKTIYQNWRKASGVYVVEIQGRPGKRYILKVIHKQMNFERNVEKYRAINVILPGRSAQYVGHTYFRIGLRRRMRGMIFEFKEGVATKEIGVLDLINRETFKEANEIFDLLVENGIIPLDFHFIVGPKGRVQIIDVDLFESLKSAELDPIIHKKGQTVRQRIKARIAKVARERTDEVVSPEVYEQLQARDREIVDLIRHKIIELGEGVLAKYD